jgi:twitching motility protein PilT
VIQRELGTHMPSFAEGVRAAMREDPDVILVGELRDAETISMAMTAAETGHLVLGTLHTTSAVKTIDRIIDALPIEEREQTKSFLVPEPARRGDPGAVKTPTTSGRKRDLRSDGDDQARSPSSSRPTRRTRSRASCRRAASSACSCWTRRCWRPCRRRKSIRRRLFLRREKRLFQKYVTDTSLLPKLESAGAEAAPWHGSTNSCRKS